jgi:hypothetical protein
MPLLVFGWLRDGEHDHENCWFLVFLVWEMVRDIDCCGKWCGDSLARR